MKNYICIDGKKIKISRESADILSRNLNSSSGPRGLIEAIDKIGKFIEDDYVIKAIKIGKEWFVAVPLPNCNKEWTLEAFDYVKRFCNEYEESYPVHYSGHKNSEYLYIAWR